MKVTNPLTWRWEFILDYQSGPHVIIRVLIRRHGRQKRDNQGGSRSHWPDVAGLGDGPGGHKPRRTGDF